MPFALYRAPRAGGPRGQGATPFGTPEGVPERVPEGVRPLLGVGLWDQLGVRQPAGCRS